MDSSSLWASAQLPAYHAPGQLHDAYQQAPAQYHESYLHAPPAQHHDQHRHFSAVQQYDSYQNAPAHYYGAAPSQQQPLYDHSSYDQSYYNNPPPSRYASSQSHYQAVGAEAETHYLRSAYDGFSGAAGADVGGYMSYPVSVAGAQRLSVKDAIRQFGADPNVYGGPALHAQPNNSSIVPTPVRPFPRGRNLLGPRHIKNTMKKKAKGLNTVKSQSAYCQVCKVECNTEEVLKSHKAGKKHKKNLETLKESISMKPSKPPGGTAPQPSKTEPVTAKPATEDAAKSKKKKTGSENEDLETKKRRVLEGGAPAEGVKICTLCNVVCNSPVVFNYHVEGHKHKAMVQKLQEGQQAEK